MKKLKFIIVDDHKLFCDGLSQILSSQPNFEIIATFNNGQQLIDSKEIHLADILILDLNLPQKSGLTILKEIRPYFKFLKIICLSMIYDKITVRNIQDAGADGYFSKEIDSSILIEKINTIIKKTRGFITQAPTQQTENIHIWTNNFKLTKREVEIVQLLSKGHTSKEISALLNRSIYTIETHRKNILRKTNTKSLIDLLKLSVKKGWT